MPGFSPQESEFTARSIDLLRFEEHLRRQIMRRLKQLERELIALFQTSGIGDAVRQSTKMKRLALLMKDVRATLAAANRYFKSITTKELSALAEAQMNIAATILNKAFAVSLFRPDINADIIAVILDGGILGAEHPNKFWTRQAKALSDRFNGVVSRGILQGWDTPTITRAIRGTQATGFTDGIMSASRRQAEALVRTSVQSVANGARLNFYDQNKDVFSAVRWVSTLDTDTTKICINLDGKKWDMETRQPIGHEIPFPGPIAHWNCRSTQIPVTKTLEEMATKNKTLARKMDEAARAGRLRASKAGPTAGGMKSFLDSLTVTELNEQLGVRIATLYRKGLITHNDLLRPGTLSPRTASELEKLAGVDPDI